jgi:hypothetical protein
LLGRSGAVPSRCLGIDDDPPAPSAAGSALASARAACGTRAVAPLAAGRGAPFGTRAAGLRAAVAAAGAASGPPIATRSAGTRATLARSSLARSSLAGASLARASLARAAIASRAAGAAPTLSIALTLAAATRAALGAALLRRWSVLKNSRAASGGTRPPNRLARRRLGRPRHLTLAAIVAVGRAPVARLLRPARLLPAAARPLGPPAGGAGPLSGRSLLTASAGLPRTTTRCLLCATARLCTTAGSLLPCCVGGLSAAFPGPRAGRGRRLAVGRRRRLGAVARSVLRRGLRRFGRGAVAEGAGGLRLLDARGGCGDPKAGLLEDGQGLLRGDPSLLGYLVDALLCHSRTKSMVSCCTITGARNERASGSPDDNLSAHSAWPHT